MTSSSPVAYSNPATIGAYPVIAKAGEDPTTQSWVCRDPGSTAPEPWVFIRSLRPELRTDEVLRGQFSEVARVGSLLVHPNIPHTEELGEQDGVLYTVQPFVEGPNLAQVIERQRRLGVRDLRFAARVCLDVAEALEFAYASINPSGRPLRVVHGRIAPESLLISAMGRVALIGFVPPWERADRSRAASPHLAPEAILQGKNTHQTDLFGVGVLLYSLCTHESPWGVGAASVDRETGRFTEVRPVVGLPPALSLILHRALAHDPDHRYARAGELADDLRSWLEGSQPVPDAEVVATIQSLFPEGPLGWKGADLGGKPRSASSAVLPLLVALMLGGTLLALTSAVVGIGFLLQEVAEPAPIVLDGPGLPELQRAEVALEQDDLDAAALAIASAEILSGVQEPVAERLALVASQIQARREARAILEMIGLDPVASMQRAQALSEAHPEDSVVGDVLLRARAALSARQRAAELAQAQGQVPSAELKITGIPPGAEVFVDRVLVTGQPVHTEITPGRHRLSIRGADGSTIHSQQIEISAGQIFQLELADR